MLRTLTLAAVALSRLSLLSAAPAVSAEQCRDAKGQFTKCPVAKPAAPAHCKDAEGRFAKCGRKGAMPM